MKPTSAEPQRSAVVSSVFFCFGLVLGSFFINIILSVIDHYEKNRSNIEIISPLPDDFILPTPSSFIPETTPTVATRSGVVSWYGEEYCKRHNPNCKTSTGERFDENQLTAACRNDIPLGSSVRIRYGQREVLVSCNDRGSFTKKYSRDFDLSKAAFAALAPTSKGVLEVSYELTE